eukprot:scaffold4762_cov398-Prasinococcus_capsulatus_cf.AAC.9
MGVHTDIEARSYSHGHTTVIPGAMGEQAVGPRVVPDSRSASAACHQGRTWRTLLRHVARIPGPCCQHLAEQASPLPEAARSTP